MTRLTAYIIATNQVAVEVAKGKNGKYLMHITRMENGKHRVLLSTEPVHYTHDDAVRAGQEVIQAARKFIQEESGEDVVADDAKEVLDPPIEFESARGVKFTSPSADLRVDVQVSVRRDSVEFPGALFEFSRWWLETHYNEIPSFQGFDSIQFRFVGD